MDAENRVKGLKSPWYLISSGAREYLGDLMQQNKERLAGFLPSKTYKAEENPISALP